MAKAKILLYVLLFLTLLGLADAGYLTIDHYRNALPPCPLHNIFIDCGAVLRSKYSMVLGVPLSLIGFLHYSYLFILVSLSLFRPRKLWTILLGLEVTVGLLSSVYFMYLQFFVIKNLCVYCTASAIISALIFLLALPVFMTYIKTHET